MRVPNFGFREDAYPLEAEKSLVVYNKSANLESKLMHLCVFELNPELEKRRERLSFQIIGKK
jgi:hypothetical protein